MTSPANSPALAHLAQRRAKIALDLSEVERQVYDLETAYLVDHSSNGNVLKGFEPALAQTKPSASKKLKPFKSEERGFSVSSSTSIVVDEIAAEAEAVRTTASGRLAKAPTAFSRGFQ